MTMRAFVEKPDHRRKRGLLSFRSGVDWACSLIVVPGVLVLLSGCGKKQGDLNDPATADPYAGWEYYTYQNIRILYQPGHPHQARFEEYCHNYEVALQVIAGRLDMAPYTDTLLVVFYTGWGQGREMTGHEYPFGTDTAIHFWLPSFPGPTLMQHLLPRWSSVQPSHQFLRHGLISLYDFSGQDYHRSTLNYLDDGEFIPLADLSADTNINSDTERHQSAEAASFCAFLLGEWGVPTLRKMYESELPFDQTVNDLLGLSADSLEVLWLLSARINMRPDSAAEDRRHR